MSEMGRELTLLDDCDAVSFGPTAIAPFHIDAQAR
jgi:hypothetical protein